MSFLLRASRLAARPAPISLTPRTFTSSGIRALKEGDRNQTSGEHNEHHIKDQLQKQKEGKGHWKPELASNSEEAVAADRHSESESPEELQKRTAGHAEEKHKAGTSQHSGL